MEEIGETIGRDDEQRERACGKLLVGGGVMTDRLGMDCRESQAH